MMTCEDRELSVVEFQPELHGAVRIRDYISVCLLARDYSERTRRRYVVAGRSPRHRVRQIERFGAELNCHSLHWLEVLEEREIQIVQARLANVRQEPPDVAESVIRRLREDGLYEILIQPARNVPAPIWILAVVCRTDAGAVQTGGVTAVRDRHRDAFLEG